MPFLKVQSVSNTLIFFCFIFGRSQEKLSNGGIYKFLALSFNMLFPDKCWLCLPLTTCYFAIDYCISCLGRFLILSAPKQYNQLMPFFQPVVNECYLGKNSLDSRFLLIMDRYDAGFSTRKLKNPIVTRLEPLIPLYTRLALTLCKLI